MDSTIRSRMKSLGVDVSDILLPKKEIDYGRWAVVACDQFTSQKDYWQSVELMTADHPSTYDLIFPECYLEDDDRQERIARIEQSMKDYMDAGIFDTYRECTILVERSTSSGTRYGLMLAIDLEKYSYAPDSRSLVRATEGTILSRIPPRKEIRRNAMLELPHIMVLISDMKRLVIEPLVARRAELRCIYDTELMKGGGHVRGYLVDRNEDLERMVEGLEALYRSLDHSNPLMYAMGDGNHSLATARSLYEDLKKEIGTEAALEHPSRYALVEIENIFDPALCFEAIHRVFFNTPVRLFDETLGKICDSVMVETVPSLDEMRRRIDDADGSIAFGVIAEGRHMVYHVTSHRFALGASVIQSCIDTLTAAGGTSVDYIHGADVTQRIANEGENIGIIMSDISKETFFDDIIRDGAFPRKTFSIGHAEEKRYYMEARRIR